MIGRVSVACMSLAVLAMTSVAQSVPLTWAPPVLENPITLYPGASGSSSYWLDNSRDYIVRLPNTLKTGGLTLQNGRNIVIIGGHITIFPNQQWDNRGIYIKNTVGTVHIEGVLIDGSGGADSDGIVVNAPEAIVQIQNCRIVGLTGRVDGLHADIVQPWGGVKELRIDHLTGSTNYQGLQISPDLGPIEKAILRNVDLFYSAPPATGYVTYLLWMTRGLYTNDTYEISLENLYITPREGQSFGVYCTWPSTAVPAGYEAALVDGQLTFPNQPTISGSVRQGPPPGGHFVPEGVAGVNYIPATVLGDFNGDGVVDLADYTVWADHYGQDMAQEGFFPPGSYDPVSGSKANLAHYTTWADHYGEIWPQYGR